MSGLAFEALLLAGSRPGGDPLAREAGLPTKALLPIAGRAMILRVLDALRASSRVRGIRIVGLAEEDVARSPELAALVERGGVACLRGMATPSTSVVAAIDAAPGAFPLLVTTADHPLLTPAAIDAFCERAAAGGGDFAVGLVPAAIVRAAFPGARRTWLRFRGEEFCSCNLFAVLTPRGRRVPEAWVRIEAERKRPWKLVAALGPLSLARFLLGRLSLADAFALGSRKLGADVRPVLMDEARIAVDVDRAGDRALAESILASDASPSRE